MHWDWFEYLDEVAGSVGNSAGVESDAARKEREARLDRERFEYEAREARAKRGNDEAMARAREARAARERAKGNLGFAAGVHARLAGTSLQEAEGELVAAERSLERADCAGALDSYTLAQRSLGTAYAHLSSGKGRSGFAKFNSVANRSDRLGRKLLSCALKGSKR